MKINQHLPVVNERKNWRKLVKKLRRKRVRQKAAAARTNDVVLSGNDTNQSSSDEMNDEESKRMSQQWLMLDEEAQAKWRKEERSRMKKERKKQALLEKMRKEKEETQLRILQEKEEEEKRQAEMNARIEYFLVNGGPIPAELLGLKETNPGKDPCPFFSKVAACRFGPTCSRNHITPIISKTLLIPGFYSHITLNQTRAAEYDTDVALEFDENEMLRDFREFFEDVVEELKQFGTLSIVQVCKNSEPHLRGNVYVVYEDERSALAAARKLNARWYGGRQLTVAFASVPDWGAAVCGDYHRGRCPKGNECNFMHTFRNPGRLLAPKPPAPAAHQSHHQGSHHHHHQDHGRAWRWSESPDRQASKKRRRSRSRSRDRDRHRSKNDRDGRRSRDYRSRRHPRRDRSRERPEHSNHTSSRRVAITS